jgi:hypothetical protein
MRRSKWEWTKQQQPPAATRKTWNKVIEEAFIEEEDITHHLGMTRVDTIKQNGTQTQGKEHYTAARKVNGSKTRRNNMKD